MLRLLTILVVVATFTAATGNGTLIGRNLEANCSPASLDQTKSCLDAYFTGYGLNLAQLPPFSDYVSVIVDLTTHFGANGVDIFCSLEVNVENCLGDLFSSPCMTAAAFQEMYGMSMGDALEYATDFPMRAYMCNNKQLMKDNNDCFDDILTKHMDERRICSNAVEDALQHVTDGDYCKPWGDYVSCTDDVYVKYCGQQVEGYICNVLEVGINFDSMDTCKSSLPICG